MALAHPKDTYRTLAYKGFVWGGVDGTCEGEPLHFFQREDRDALGLPKYTVVQCKESELFDTCTRKESKYFGKSSFQILVDLGMTR